MQDPKERTFHILEKERILDGFFTVDRYTLKHSLFRGGQSPALKRYLLHRPDATAAVVYHRDKHALVLVRQFRVGMMTKEKDPWSLELPAGLVDAGEDPEECIKREILEETGFRVRTCRFLHSAFASPGIITEKLHFYFAEVSAADKREQGGGEPGDEEDIEVVYVTRDELKDLLRRGNIRDVKTLLGIYSAGGLLDWSLHS